MRSASLGTYRLSPRATHLRRMLAADSHSRARWEGLREALAKRYANAAEAYVAMGGRAGGEISLQQLERSLQDLNARVLGLRRGSTAVRSVDVHAILADVERSFQTGINFQQFASALAWEAKGPDVLRSKESQVYSIQSIKILVVTQMSSA